MAKYLDEDGARYLVSKILALLNDKTDKEAGKGLSTEDFTTALKNKLLELNNYSLPIADDDTLGGIKIGSGLTIDQNGVVSASGGDISGASAMTNAEIDALFE
jgi:hypothetical protein